MRACFLFLLERRTAGYLLDDIPQVSGAVKSQQSVADGDFVKTVSSTQ